MFLNGELFQNLYGLCQLLWLMSVIWYFIELVRKRDTTIPFMVELFCLLCTWICAILM